MHLKEILAGALMGLDVLALYALLPNVQRKLVLSLWSAFLHMLFPLVGYYLGDYIYKLLMHTASYLSVLFLFSIGMHFLLSDEQRNISQKIPYLLAVTASLDTFSLGVSFGILSLKKHLFIIVAGLSAFVCSLLALYFSPKLLSEHQTMMNRLIGIIFLLLSWLAYFNMQ